MHSLRLNIEDSVFDKVIYFLQNLPKEDIIIVENKIIENFSVKEEKEDLEIKAFSNHSANLIEEWKDIDEDDVWK